LVLFPVPSDDFVALAIWAWSWNENLAKSRRSQKYIMKITSSLLLSATLLAIGASNAGGAVVAYWNFNSLTTSTNNGTSYAATSGSGTITVGVAASDQAGSNRGINSFGGTTNNVLNSDPAGQALTVQGGASESATPVQNNGATLTIEVDLTGMEDVIVSYATQKTNTGFNSNQFSYSTDGIGYTSVGSVYDLTTSFALKTFNLSSYSVLDNDSTVYFRITFNGATSNAGNNRIDNIQINATAVPETSAALLGALGVLGLLRRRR
jgi:hypothetical protein